MHEQAEKIKGKDYDPWCSHKITQPCGGERASIKNKGAVAIDRGCTAPDTMHEHAEKIKDLVVSQNYALLFPQNYSHPAVGRERAE